MNKLPLFFQEFGNAFLDIQINQVYWMKEFFHQPAQEPVEPFRRATSYGNVKI